MKSFDQMTRDELIEEIHRMDLELTEPRYLVRRLRQLFELGAFPERAGHLVGLQSSVIGGEPIGPPAPGAVQKPVLRLVEATSID